MNEEATLGRDTSDLKELALLLQVNQTEHENLEEELVRAIRKANSEGLTYKEIGDLLGVDTSTAWRIANAT